MNKQDLVNAQKIINLCKKKNLHVSCAESCTGGLISAALTELSGSSNVFLGGIVSYTQEVKMSVLGVNPYIIKNKGVVSSQTACAMADGVRTITGSDIAISTTGIAGPTGAEPGKPVGTIYFGISTNVKCYSILTCEGKSRNEIRQLAVSNALAFILKELAG